MCFVQVWNWHNSVSSLAYIHQNFIKQHFESDFIIVENTGVTFAEQSLVRKSVFLTDGCKMTD